jgi:hypothetical protein
MVRIATSELASASNISPTKIPPRGFACSTSWRICRAIAAVAGTNRAQEIPVYWEHMAAERMELLSQPPQAAVDDLRSVFESNKFLFRRN